MLTVKYFDALFASKITFILLFSLVYINVKGRSHTTLTFLLKELEYYLYNCYNLYEPSLVHQHDHSGNTSYLHPHYQAEVAKSASREQKDLEEIGREENRGKYDRNVGRRKRKLQKAADLNVNDIKKTTVAMGGTTRRKEHNLVDGVPKNKGSISKTYTRDRTSTTPNEGLTTLRRTVRNARVST